MHALTVLAGWLAIAAGVLFWVSLLVLLPLSLWRRARAWTGFGFVLASYAMGAFTLVWGAVATLAAWGWGVMIVCALLIGLPLVPVGFCAMGFHFHQWLNAWSLLGCLALTFAMRIGGVAIAEHGDDSSLSEDLRQARTNRIDRGGGRL